MGRLFAQLWYTWALHGLDGPSRFQVRAASQAMAPGGQLAVLARRLCRYEMPAGVYDAKDAPISFGWIDSGPTRFVFRRTATRPGDEGQPAAFGAHIIAGPMESCPAKVALSLWNSDFWRDVDDGGNDLARSDVDVMELSESAPPVDPPGEGELRDFLAAVLSTDAGHPQVRWDASPDLMVSVMAAALELQPAEMLERMSFSTYEPVTTALSFDICGVSRHNGAPPSTPPSPVQGSVTPLAVRVTGSILDPSLESEVRAAKVVAQSETGFGLALFSAACDALVQSRKGVPIDFATTVRCLAVRESATVLMDQVAGRTAIASALLESETARAALAAISATLEVEHRESVGLAVAQKLIAQGTIVDSTLASLAGVDQLIFTACAEGLAEHLVGCEGFVDGVDVPARLRVLKHIQRDNARWQGAIDRLLLLPDTGLGELVDDLDITASLKAKALLPRINTGVGIQIARRAVDVDSTVAKSLAAQGLPLGRLAELITGQRPQVAASAALAVASGSDITTTGVAEVMLAAAASLPASQVLPLLLAPMLDGGLEGLLQHKEFADVCMDAVLASISPTVERAGSIPLNELRIVRRLPTSEAETLSLLLEELGKSRRSYPSVPDLFATAASLPPRSSSVAAVAIFHAAAPGVWDVDALSDLVSRTATYAAGGWFEVRRCLTAALSFRMAAQTRMMLAAYAAELAGANLKVDVEPSAGLARSEARELAIEVKTLLGPERSDEVSGAIQSKAGRKWWEGIPSKKKKSRLGR